MYWLCKKKPKVFRDSVNPEYKSEIWVIPPERQGKHPAPFPPQLVRNCIQLATEKGDTVLDPFMGSGTTALVATELEREWIGFDIDEKYVRITNERLKEGLTSFFTK